MPVNIRGKQYKTVAERVAEFREAFKEEYAIVTEVVSIEQNVIVKASIMSPNGEHVHATGFAEEVRGSTNINKTSALENCETSAIGRALAAFGFGGTEYATANEVTDAIIQQHVMEAKEKALSFYQNMGRALRDNWESVVFIKEQLSLGEIDSAREAFNELSDADKEALWVSTKAGGPWSTEERKLIKEGN